MERSRTRFSTVFRRAIWLVLAACSADEIAYAQNLLGQTGVHDPSTIVKQDGTYYLYYTGTRVRSKTSTDLLHWTEEPRVFSTPPSWVSTAVPNNTNGDFWAPDVAFFNNEYHLYYSVSTFGSQVSAIGLATNPTLNRNDHNFLWTDQGAVLKSQAGNAYNAIDPSIFQSSSGDVWMTFGSFWNGIYMMQIDPTTGLQKTRTPITPVAYNSSIEASYLYEHDNKYYLFADWGTCCSGVNSTYNIRVGRSSNVTGPFLDRNGVDMRSGGGSLFLGTEGPLIGPGHISIFSALGTDWFSYHYYDGNANGASKLNIRDIRWGTDGWPVAGPAFPVPEPASIALLLIGCWSLICPTLRSASRHKVRCLSLIFGVLYVVAGKERIAQAAEPKAHVTIDVRAEGQPVPKTLHGLFFEDINYAADGGLYAELVQNRSFEHKSPLYAWQEVASDDAKGRLEVTSEAPLNANNTHFLRIYAPDHGDSYGVANSGFDGIALKENGGYYLSLYARVRAGDERTLDVQLEDNSGKELVEHRFSGLTPEWRKYEAEVVSPVAVTDARLVVHATGPGVIDIDMVSVFPKETFKSRRNGLRADLAQALADAKPGFLRFPGGCVVEGMDLANAYRWKDTIGDVAERKQNWNLWQDKQSSEYNQTYGLGFFEYFQFCEDIGAEPLPVVNCGMSCQARRRGTHVPVAELGPWIQDALDLIEFANGPTTSTWGARRATLGHPEPFHLRFLAIGNEQWNAEYFDRYVPFQRAVKLAHPEIATISTSGPFVGDALWNFAWNQFHSGTPADLVDEHYYVQPRWLLEHVDRYATYSARDPKIFVGEFAAHDGRGRRNNLRAALAEAAYMTGLVRHADIVEMASYAPLFGKYGHAQWHPNLIWFDNTRVVLTPSYYVQAMFAQNRPDVVVPIKVETDTDSAHPSGMIGVGTWKTQAEYRDVKVVNPVGETLFASDFKDGHDDWRVASGEWTVVDGVLRQTSGDEDVRAIAGDSAWQDYTLTLRARKLSGEEGFLILFHTPNSDQPTWWNLGGWRNTAHAFQGNGVAEDRLPGNIETNRWYDIRIELTGGHVKGYLDGQLIQEAESTPVPLLYAAAGRDERAKELVVQLVNPFDEACPTTIQLAGLGSQNRAARLIVLEHADANSENTLNSPNAIAPLRSELSNVSEHLDHLVRPHSVEILRIPLVE